jgi:hypothetical protein
MLGPDRNGRDGSTQQFNTTSSMGRLMPIPSEAAIVPG